MHLIRSAAILAAALLCSTALSGRGATVLWTNTSGGLWNATSNWSPNTVPASGDTVFITNAGTYTVAINVNATLGGLFVGADNGTQTVSLASATLTLNGPGLFATNTAFELSGGSLAGPGEAIFAGKFTWSGGAMTTTGGRTVFTNSATVLLNGGVKTFQQRTLDNYTTVTWSAGQWNVGNSAVWNSFGALNITADVTAFFVGGGSAVFNNGGTLQKSAGAGTASFGFVVNNGSSVHCASGTLALAGGGVSSGAFGTDPGCNLDFVGGTHSLIAGAGFGGGGLFRINGGALAFNTDLVVNPAFELAPNGVIEGTNSAIFAGPFTWSGGTMESFSFGPGGRTVFTNSATVVISTANTKTHYRRRIDNYTTVTWSAGQWNVGNSAVWNNFGALNITADVTAFFVGGGSAVFNNGGTLQKSAGAGTASFGFVVNNANSVQSLSGVLSLALGGTNTGAFSTVGGTFLDFSAGTYHLLPGTGFDGGGLFRINGGALAFHADIVINPAFELAPNGAIEGTNSAIFAGPFTWSGGTMESFSFGPGGRTVFTNSATVVISTANTKTHYRRLIDNYTTVTHSAGQFSVGNGARWNNYGTYDLAADVNVTFVGGVAPIFNNLGVLRKTAGTGPGSSFGYLLNNANSVQSLSGVLSLALGGTNTGAFSTVGGTFLDFSAGTYHLLPGTGFDGGGLFRINGGALAFHADIVINPAFELAPNGAIEGTNSAIFAGPFTWSGGTMESFSFGPGGRTVFTNSATVVINTANTKTHYRRAVVTYGTVTWSAGQVSIGNGARWNHFGTLDIAADVNAVFVGGASPWFHNAGLVRKTAGGASASFQYSFTNTGTVRAQSGVLGFPVAYVQNAGLTELAGGRFSGALLDIRGGLLTGSGNVAANVSNNGEVAPGSGVGLLTISNNVAQTYTSTTNSLLGFQIGGLTPITQHDQLRVNGSATLAGTLWVELANGYIPTIGNAYTVMTYTARSGAFTNFYFPDYEFAVLQTATNIILIASNAFPAITLTAPTNELTCRVFTMTASAFDLENGLTNLSFLIGGSVVHSVENPGPNQRYRVRVAVDYPGLTTLSARAMDNKGGIRQTNITTLFENQPLHVMTAGGVLSNTFRLCMVGETGQTYNVYSTTNIETPASNWVNIGTMELLTNGPLRFVDTNLTNYGLRFYRARQE